MPAFLARYPKLRVRFDLNDRMVDLVSEKVDLAIRITGRLDDATLVQRRLCPIRFVVCAAPSYLRRNGTPRVPADLERHNCLGIHASPWRPMFARARRVRLQGDLQIDNGDALRRVAVLGQGVVCLPTYLVGDDLRAGRLVRVLPDELVLEASAFAIYPHSRNPSTKVRALIDFLAAEFGPDPEWDAGLDGRPRRRRR
jgi:DNA-binding transcriptional LysR family regulator